MFLIIAVSVSWTKGSRETPPNALCIFALFFEVLISVEKSVLSFFQAEKETSEEEKIETETKPTETSNGLQ